MTAPVSDAAPAAPAIAAAQRPFAAAWGGVVAGFRREWTALFATPLASIFIAAFVASSVMIGFQIGELFETNRADLQPFFQFHPWLHLVFMPALAMRAWAEEARTGTLETLLSLPVPTWALVVGKFLAGWAAAGLALAGTVPLWIAISLLGPVDHGATAMTYLGSWLAAGTVLAIGQAASAASSSQVIAYVLGVGLAFVFTAAGLPLATDTLRAAFGDAAGEAVALASLLDPFDAVQRGVMEARSLVFWLSFIAAFLAIATLLVDAKRGGGR